MVGGYDVAGGARRMKEAATHEETVAEEIRKRGWNVDRFDTLSRATRDALSAIPQVCYMRWLPDLVCSRLDWPAKSGRFVARVMLVDAKTTLNPHTDNHSVELHAINALQQISSCMRCLGLFVFGDLTCLDCWEALDCCKTGQAAVVDRSKGSGTPYILIPKSETRPLDQAFGSVSTVVAERHQETLF